MFKFHKLAIKNTKSHWLLTFVFAMINVLILFVLCQFLPKLYLSKVSNDMQETLIQKGNVDPQQLQEQLQTINIIVLVVIAIIFLLVGYQLLAGSINVISKSIKKQKFGFSDLLVSFKGGKYISSILLGIISLILYIALTWIHAFLLKYLFKIVGELIKPLEIQSQNTLLIIQIVTFVFVSFIISILLWIVLIPMINSTVQFTQDRNKTAIASLEDGFKGIANGQKTWFKFFVGVLLINLIALIISLISSLDIYLLQNMSQTLAYNIHIAIIILVAIITIIIHYLNTLGVVQYFIRNGEPVNVSQSKKDKKSSKKHKSESLNSQDDNDLASNNTTSTETHTTKPTDEQIHTSIDERQK